MGAIDATGKSLFSQRHAVEHALPVADPAQDYTLIELSETNGWTTMHFARNISGCDPADLPVAFGLTNRVIASFRRVDKPVGTFEPTMTLQHDWRVVVSIELLSGVEPAYPSDATGTLDITFQNASIPGRFELCMFTTAFDRRQSDELLVDGLEAQSVAAHARHRISGYYPAERADDDASHAALPLLRAARRGVTGVCRQRTRGGRAEEAARVQRAQSDRWLGGALLCAVFVTMRCVAIVVAVNVST